MHAGNRAHCPVPTGRPRRGCSCPRPCPCVDVLPGRLPRSLHAFHGPVLKVRDHAARETETFTVRPFSGKFTDPELFRGSSNSVSQVLRPGLASPPRCPPPVSVREPRERPARPSSRRAGHVGPAQSLRWLLTRPGPHPEASTASPGALSPGPPAAGPRPTAWHRLPRALHVLLPRGRDFIQRPTPSAPPASTVLPVPQPFLLPTTTHTAARPPSVCARRGSAAGDRPGSVLLVPRPVSGTVGGTQKAPDKHGWAGNA